MAANHTHGDIRIHFSSPDPVRRIRKVRRIENPDQAAAEVGALLTPSRQYGCKPRVALSPALLRLVPSLESTS